MITSIKNIEDVKIFARQLIEEGVNFHPDDDFNDMINIETDQPTYLKDDAEKRNELMSQCFDVCEKEGFDFYDVTMEVTLVENGLDKFIPLPSHPYTE